MYAQILQTLDSDGVATNGISSTSHKNEKGSMTNYDPDFYRDEIQVSNEEYQKYKIAQQAIEKEQSLKEIEEDIKKLKK